MRKLEDLQADKRVNEIISKLKYEHFPRMLKEISEYYLQDNEDGDVYFLDAVLALEPLLKQEICRNHITENEMDYFFDFYSSATCGDEEWYKLPKYEWCKVKVCDGHCWCLGVDILQHKLVDTGETVTLEYRDYLLRSTTEIELNIYEIMLDEKDCEFCKYSIGNKFFIAKKSTGYGRDCYVSIDHKSLRELVERK